MSIPEGIKIGTRIQVGKNRATVKYVGPVENTKGDWLGVEWDEPTRGKHNGLHKDTKYFDCSHPTSGSFIRFQADKVSLGQTFLQALRGKYNSEQEENSVTYDKTRDRGEVYWGGNKNLIVETYGFGKVQQSLRRLSSLLVVGLAEELISSAGSPNEIDEAQLTIQDLDLSMNLIGDWETVAAIVSQLPQLQILRLNQSRIMNPIESLGCSNIQSLALNRSMISWKDVEILVSGLSKLENLQLAGNGIKGLSAIKCDSLKSLYLEDNFVEDWDEIGKLQSLPNLRVLFLTNNKITIISSSFVLPQLEHLCIDNNAINNLNSIDSLNSFPNLQKLRMKNNSVFEGLDREAEGSQIVGRIKSLDVLNGNTITPRKRNDLERYYLSMCAKDGPTHQEISLLHPRYIELCKKHGEPDLQMHAQKPTSMLNDRLIEITISLMDSHNSDILTVNRKDKLPTAAKTTTKRFLPTMSVRNIKHLIQKLLKVPATKQKLYLLQYVEGEENIMIMNISDDLRDLKFYEIKQGDEILVFK